MTGALVLAFPPKTARKAPWGPYTPDPSQWPSALPDAPWAALGEGMAMDFPTADHSCARVDRAAHLWGRWLGRVFQVTVLRLANGVQVSRVTRIK